MVKWNDIDYAVYFVSGDVRGMNRALLNLDTGKIFYTSDMAGIDQVSDLEESAGYDPSRYVDIPHEHDLDLGKRLIFDFVGLYAPDALYEVEQMFRRRGAYSRYKAFLTSNGLLDQWYAFEHARRETELRRWCKQQGVELED